MASGIFTVLDDISTLMDDVATATKVASQKTMGILGDDLAVNAEKSTGFVSSREIPVLWKITKGSLLNKAIIIPIIFLLNVYLPTAITIILMIGGVYLAFEGAEKVIEFLFHRHKETEAPTPTENQHLPTEAQKVKSAVRTDFILSLEIVIIALSTVLDKPLSVRIITVLLISILATVGVYGFVALIVRMDDLGYKLIQKAHEKGFLNTLGQLLVKALPVIVKILSVVGTFALLEVAGGLFLHNIPYLHHLLHAIPFIISAFILGLIIGSLAFLLIEGGKKLFHSSKKTTT